ncbi:uncharacterized protein EKO05_0008937 [Ascochyta rabiei]|uniref:uncharacterized protein n=1 Tax=Didymella rabiei TaxID=5454 RepID=UPI002202A624|nr:uncharacterized protein EKO05_0008937 [Ascochyta rabiei]UPX18645.1 hypothetical protein EKO05_0008937 [Ascochyta rabiei]
MHLTRQVYLIVVATRRSAAPRSRYVSRDAAKSSLACSSFLFGRQFQSQALISFTTTNAALDVGCDLIYSFLGCTSSCRLRSRACSGNKANMTLRSRRGKYILYLPS